MHMHAHTHTCRPAFLSPHQSWRPNPETNPASIMDSPFSDTMFPSHTLTYTLKQQNQGLRKKKSIVNAVTSHHTTLHTLSHCPCPPLASLLSRWLLCLNWHMFVQRNKSVDVCGSYIWHKQVWGIYIAKKERGGERSKSFSPQPAICSQAAWVCFNMYICGFMFYVMQYAAVVVTHFRLCRFRRTHLPTHNLGHAWWKALARHDKVHSSHEEDMQ